VTVDEWDLDTGLRIVRARQFDFAVGGDDQWRPPPWHPERGDGPDPDGSADFDGGGPVPPALPSSGAAAQELDE